ncbi:MAG: tetratricopeptide repeat protein [bacterium]
MYVPLQTSSASLVGYCARYLNRAGRMFGIFQLNVKEKASVASPQSILYISTECKSYQSMNSAQAQSMVTTNKIALAFLIIYFSILPVLAQAQSVQLKVKEKSGLFGMSGERFAQVDLSNQSRTFPLTSENVNDGQYFYFIFRSIGDWKLDPDFLKEELPKLTLYQSEKTVGAAFKGDIVTDSNRTSILIGFPKDVKIHQLFLVQFQLGEAKSQGEIKVPQELWPGYSFLISTLSSAEKAMGAKQYKEAMGYYEQLLKKPELDIFPQYAAIQNLRTTCFAEYLKENTAFFTATIASESIKLKEKIAQVDLFRPVFQFVVDSLPIPLLRISESEGSVKAIIDQANEAIRKTGLTRDSLKRALDNENVQWIIDARIGQKPSYVYHYMIEALAHAFSSLNFSDTTAAWKPVLPAELQTQLTKYEVSESYYTFLQLANQRLRNRQAIFPDPFLANVQKDSTFPLPYYSMLKTVSDFYAGDFPAARQEIIKIFTSSYEPELSERFDFLRVLMDIREKKIPPDILKLLSEAGEAARIGNNEAAQEKYRQSITLAPGFAYSLYSLGKYYAQANDPIRALTFFQQAYLADTMYLSAYREAFTLYRKGGNYKPMIEVLSEALLRGNDYWEININLGFGYMGDGDPVHAIEHFLRALELNSKSYLTNIQLGLAYQTGKDYQKAREYFNKAIAIDPLRQDAVDFLQKLNEIQKQAR